LIRFALGQRPVWFEVNSVKHAIITCVDAKYGDFLIDHWYRSLREHGNLSAGNVDVIVLDYGLNSDQKKRLNDLGVHLHASVRDGHLTNIRYRDMATALRERSYDQALAIDGGDVIFQGNISHLFEHHKDHFRAACEPFYADFQAHYVGLEDFHPDAAREILTLIGDRRMINGGVIFGPAARFAGLWATFQKYCRSFQKFASDQMVMSYLLYKEGFVELEERFNFCLITTKSAIAVDRGVFIDRRGQPIPIVHNNGEQDQFRVVKNFGFGPDRNQVQWGWKRTLRFRQGWDRFKRRLFGRFAPAK
jgi:hypothetical protein